MRKKRTTITTTITETIALAMPSGACFAGCPACGRVSRFVTFEQARDELGIGVGELVRRIAAGELHWIEANGGIPLFCVGP